MSKLEERGFPLIKVHGSNYEIGYQHGEKCSELIKDHLKISLQAIQEKGIRKEKALEFSMQCIKFAESYAPHLVEELNGIADGAGVSREEICFLNTGHPKKLESCTTFVVFGGRTDNGSTIITQNVDNPRTTRTVERGIILHLTPREGPAILALCRAGNLYVHGINSAGMVRLGNELSSVLDRDFGTPSAFICRRILEQTTIEDALGVVREAKSSGSQADIMAESSGRVAQVEWCPDSLAVLEPYENVPSKGYFFHTNHFLHPDMLKYEGRSGDKMVSSSRRLERIKQLFVEWDKTGEPFRVEAAKIFVSDHVNSPDSICRHPGVPERQVFGQTVACVIAQPAKKVIHVSRGNPCKGEFRTHTLA